MQTLSKRCKRGLLGIGKDLEKTVLWNLKFIRIFGIWTEIINTDDHLDKDILRGQLWEIRGS